MFRFEAVKMVRTTGKIDSGTTAAIGTGAEGEHTRVRGTTTTGVEIGVEVGAGSTALVAAGTATTMIGATTGTATLTTIAIVIGIVAPAREGEAVPAAVIVMKNWMASATGATRQI